MSKECKLIFTVWTLTIILFIAGCECGGDPPKPLYRVGEIVYHALDTDLENQMVVIYHGGRKPKYMVRTNDSPDAIWMYEGELRDKDGQQRMRKTKKMKR